MSTHEHFSEKDLDRLLHIFATNGEAQLPDSDEEIRSFFRLLDLTSVPTPNVEKFKSFLSRELHPKTKLMSAAEIFKDLLGKQQSMLSAEGSLVAARKGKRIKAKTRAQIDKAKKKRPQ